jgi:hypothetical protein
MAAAEVAAPLIGDSIAPVPACVQVCDRPLTEAPFPSQASEVQQYHKRNQDIIRQNEARHAVAIQNVLEAREYVVARLLPQLVYALEQADTRSVQWIDVPLPPRQDLYLQNVLGNIGIQAYQDRTQLLTPEAAAFMLRAYKLSCCKKFEARLNADKTDQPEPLFPDLVYSPGSFFQAKLLHEESFPREPQTQLEKRQWFIDDEANYLDWDLVVQLVRKQTFPTGDPHLYIGHEIHHPRPDEERFRRDAFNAPKELLKKQQFGYDYQKNVLGRPYLQKPLPAVAPGGPSEATQNQYELREYPHEYESDIRNLLLLRYDLLRCGETAASKPLLSPADRERCMNQLRARLFSLGIEILVADVDKRTAEYQAFVERTEKAHAQEERRGIGHNMLAYEARKKLFLESYANAPDWALLVDMRRHRKEQGKRSQQMVDLYKLAKFDPVVRQIFEQHQADPTAPFWDITTALLQVDDPYYRQMAQALRAKFSRAAEWIGRNRIDLPVLQVIAESEPNVLGALKRMTRPELEHLLAHLSHGNHQREAKVRPFTRDLDAEWFGDFWLIAPPPPPALYGRPLVLPAGVIPKPKPPAVRPRYETVVIPADLLERVRGYVRQYYQLRLQDLDPDTPVPVTTLESAARLVEEGRQGLQQATLRGELRQHVQAALTSLGEF